jgi:hypothetical protein
VIQDVPDLGIVELDLWHAVKARQQQVRHGYDRRGRRPPAGLGPAAAALPFSGLMRCGCCGGGYSKISENLFGCSTARNKGPAACTNRLKHPARRGRGQRAERL